MRQQRITTSQQEIYLIFLSEHQEFAASNDEKGNLKFNQRHVFPAHLENLLVNYSLKGEFEGQWEELTKLLNATLGPKKSVEEWKTVFMHWKNQLKIRTKKLKSVQNSDSVEANEAKLALQKLSDIEKRALKLWKEDYQDIASVSGMLKNVYISNYNEYYI